MEYKEELEQEFDINKPIDINETTRKDSINEWKHYVKINILHTALIFEKQFRVGLMFSICMRINGSSDVIIDMFHFILEIICVPVIS